MRLMRARMTRGTALGMCVWPTQNWWIWPSITANQPLGDARPESAFGAPDHRAAGHAPGMSPPLKISNGGGYRRA